MKKILIVLIVTSLITSCAAFRRHYYYNMKLVDVEANNSKAGVISNERTARGIIFGVYRDDAIEASMTFHPSYVDLMMKNKTESTIKVIWDEAVFLRLDSVSDGIIHSGVFFRDKNLSQIPSSVIKGSKLSTIIVPKGNMLIDNNKVVGRNFLPRTERFVGNNIMIEIPIIINDERVDYMFVFKSSYEKVKGISFRNTGFGGLCFNAVDWF